MSLTLTSKSDPGEPISSDEQLRRWVAGEAVHSASTGECCPDFSCCKPELLASQEIREKFRDAQISGDDATKYAFLGMFLGAAISAAAPEKKVYIAGEDAGHA